jgi:hypothetical protein
MDFDLKRLEILRRAVEVRTYSKATKSRLVLKKLAQDV